MSDIIELLTDQIKLPESNMRSTIDRDELYELADDIKKNGLINPITVRPKDGMYELVAGQRRYLAHQIAGIIRIRCVVRQLSDDEALAVMTSENLARADVNPVDEANHVGRLMTLHNGDERKVASIVNRGVQWVIDRVAIATMPDYMQEELAAGRLKLGVALHLNEITDDHIKMMWTDIAVRDGTSVAQAKYWVDGWRLNRIESSADPSSPPSGFEGGQPHVPLFECAIDGQKYDCRQFQQFFVHESNLDIFYTFVNAFRESSRSESIPAGS